ncbi:unnamed protein product [Adineta steineri]|uniref:Uncharacterized protein n=1 Tax=Adineta steineri TaxID=433720 RepID=A0A816DJE8_9BILA|nr:unnamed protein product [Adineta steineri]CAF1636799.1 unnamed protein product [Adineta steineri]
MASNATTQPLSINTTKSNEAGYDFALSPTEPGKFDFYRVHVDNQTNKNDAMFSDNYEVSNSSNDLPKRWTPFYNMKHLSDQPKTASSSALYAKSSADTDTISTNNKTLNKPIQTVASFSSLTDAVKNAMQRGHLNTTTNQLRRQANGTTLSSKELNHLSPQSM